MPEPNPDLIPITTIDNDLGITGTLYADTTSSSITTDTYASTITFNLRTSNWHQVVLTGNPTLALSNVQVGQQFTISLVQDGTGSRTVTWFSGIKWAGGSAPTLTTTANKADVFTFKAVSATSFYGFIAGQNI
jgi:hypothetical protein